MQLSEKEDLTRAGFSTPITVVSSKEVTDCDTNEMVKTIHIRYCVPDTGIYFQLLTHEVITKVWDISHASHFKNVKGILVPTKFRAIKEMEGFDFLRVEGLRKVLPTELSNVLSNGSLPPLRKQVEEDAMVPLWRFHCSNAKHDCPMKGKICINYSSFKFDVEDGVVSYSVRKPYMLFHVLLDTEECIHPCTPTQRNIVGAARKEVVDLLKKNKSSYEVFLSQDHSPGASPMTLHAVQDGKWCKLSFTQSPVLLHKKAGLKVRSYCTLPPVSSYTIIVLLAAYRHRQDERSAISYKDGDDFLRIVDRQKKLGFFQNFGISPLTVDMYNETTVAAYRKFLNTGLFIDESEVRVKNVYTSGLLEGEVELTLKALCFGVKGFGDANRIIIAECIGESFTALIIDARIKLFHNFQKGIHHSIRLPRYIVIDGGLNLFNGVCSAFNQMDAGEYGKEMLRKALNLPLDHRGHLVEISRCFIHLERALKRHMKESKVPKPLQYVGKWAWRAVYCAESGEEAIAVSVALMGLFLSETLCVQRDGQVHIDTPSMDTTLRKLLQGDVELMNMMREKLQPRSTSRLLAPLVTIEKGDMSVSIQFTEVRKRLLNWSKRKNKSFTVEEGEKLYKYPSVHLDIMEDSLHEGIRNPFYCPEAGEYLLSEYFTLFPICTESLLVRGDRTTNAIENAFKDRNIIVPGRVDNIFHYIEKRAVHMSKASQAQLNKQESAGTGHTRRRAVASDDAESALKRRSAILLGRSAEDDSIRRQLSTELGYECTPATFIQTAEQMNRGDTYSKKGLSDDEQLLCRSLKALFGQLKTQGTCTTIQALSNYIKSAALTDGLANPKVNQTTVGNMLRLEGRIKDKDTVVWLQSFLRRKLQELDSGHLNVDTRTLVALQTPGAPAAITSEIAVLQAHDHAEEATTTDTDNTAREETTKENCRLS